MLNTWLLTPLIAIVLVACNDPKPIQPEHSNLVYEFAPSLNADNVHELRVRVSFNGDLDGETQIQLGGSWADEQETWKRFKNLSLDGHGQSSQMTQTKAVIEVRHPPNADLTFSYTFSATDMRNPRDDIEYFYAPVLQQDIVHLIGVTSLAIPVLEGVEQYAIDVNWVGIPDSWETTDTLPDRPVHPGELRRQVFVAGEASMFTKSGPQNSLVIVKAGNHAFQSQAFAETVTHILAELTALWQDRETKFLVTLLGTPRQSSFSSFVGTGRYDSFASAASGDIDLDFLSLFIAHEVTHHWMPDKLGVRPNCTSGKCTDRTRWFSEGFTDFIATRVMVESGYWSRADFVKFSNVYLHEYYSSSAKHATAAAIEEKFWSDWNHERQPYWRGFILAMNWNSEISATSQGKASLTDVLLDMKTKADIAPTKVRPVLSSTYIAKQISEVAARDVHEDIEAYYVLGGLLKPRPDWFGECAELRVLPIPEYNVSFNTEITLDTGIVTGVVQGSNADKAGLKNGQIFLEKISGGGGDTSVPLVLKVSEQDRVFEVSFIPVGNKVLDVPQFELTKRCGI